MSERRTRTRDKRQKRYGSSGWEGSPKKRRELERKKGGENDRAVNTLRYKEIKKSKRRGEGRRGGEGTRQERRVAF